MKDQSTPTAWSEKSTNQRAVLVCVTDQRACERLIAYGAGIAERENAELLILNVQNRTFQADVRSDALEYLFQIANRYHADMSVFYNADPIRISNDFISRRNIIQLITGMPTDDGHFVINLQQMFPHIPLDMIPPAGMLDIRIQGDETSQDSTIACLELLGQAL